MMHLSPRSRPPPPAQTASSSTAVGDADDEKRLLMEPFSSEDWRGADERQALRPEPVLPQGAMRPRSSHSGTVPTLSYTPVRPASPSSEPSHTPEPDKVQFATYPPDEKAKPWDAEPSASRNGKGKGKKDIAWLPVPLRTWFWVSFVVDLVAIAIALEVVLYFTDKNNGWPVRGAFSSQAGFMHYVYTLPPVAVAMILVAMWAWADVEIKKMQPYVDLVHGDAPAHRSVLLDYTRTNNFIVWLRAAANKHYIVALATLMVILSLALQPLAAALLTVRDTWLSKPDQILNNTAVLALNQDDQFWDVTSFLTAAGYSSASVLYSLGDPHFVHNGYTVAPFQLPTYLATNGTVYTNTTAVLSDPGCQPAQSIQMTHNTNNDTWTISADYPGCPYTWDVSRVAENLFGVAPCNVPGDTTPDFLRPVLFWYFTYVPSAMSSITFCKPTISLYNVAVTVDLASGNLTSVTQLSPLKVGQGNFTAYAGNITGSPLNGAAYNGIAYNLSNPDPFTMARVNATQLTLPAAVFQSATTSAQGLTGVFTNNGFVGLTNSVYRTYLALVAKTVYFVPNSEPITLQVKTVEKRLWLSSVAVHLLTTALLLLAFFGTIVQLLHRGDRANLRLAHEPGTIASAVVVGAQTNMGELLSGRQRKEEIIQALRDKRFRINPRTMKIVMEGEEGYEEAASPGPRRSVFAAGLLDLMSPHPASRRFSRPPPMPQTPP